MIRWSIVVLSLLAAACGPSPRSGAPSARHGESIRTAPPAATPSEPRVVPPLVPPDGHAVPIPPGLDCLVRLYGGRAELDRGNWFFRPPAGAPILYDDGRIKDAAGRLKDPDLEDTLLPYTRDNVPSLESRRRDSGRVRHEEFFRALYGQTREDVQNSLVRIEFAGSPLLVHKNIQAPLERVAGKLELLLAKDAALRTYLTPSGGGFRWRTIEGTDRPSPHSFGIAVDLNPERAAYWRWRAAWDGKYPPTIVRAFESEGFIWGGSWEHFDSMHFEYRPELLDPECTAPHNLDLRGP